MVKAVQVRWGVARARCAGVDSPSFRLLAPQLEFSVSAHCGARGGPPSCLLTINLMSSDREAGGATPAGLFSGHWPVLPLALLGVAATAALLASLQVLPGWLLALALLLVAAGALLSGAYWGRQHQQDLLQDARQQTHLLQQLLDVWTWQTDAQHQLVRLTPPRGAPSSAWVGSAFAGQCLWQRFDDAEQTLQARLQARAPVVDLAVLQLPQTTQAHGVNPDLSRSWALRGLPRLDSRGRFAGYIGVAWSVEPARDTAAGSTLVSTRADTASGLADNSAQLALVAEQAAFAYTISHDLRAPIRVIEGFGRILKEDYGTALDRVGRDHLDRMMAAASRMNHMIDALLSLSRLSTQPLASQPVNLSQLAQWVIDDLQRSVPERQVRVHITPGMTVQGDPTLLRMALDNLLGNAWKYSARVAQADIGFERQLQDGRPVYLVRDNGAGFDMRFADRLFGVFQRLHSSSDFQGTGVGLASVRRIIRRHGGEVWAEGEVGQGARFYFTLKP